MRSSCCAATLASVVRIFTVMMPPKVYADIFGSSLWTILCIHYRFPSGEKQRCVGKPGQGEKLQAGCRRCQYQPCHIPRNKPGREQDESSQHKQGSERNSACRRGSPQLDDACCQRTYHSDENNYIPHITTGEYQKICR